MKRFFLIAGMTIALLACGGAVVFFFAPQWFPGAARTANPVLQTKRLTSFFLLRAMERFRQEAIVVQHQEEGRMLMNMLEIKNDEELFENTEEPAAGSGALDRGENGGSGTGEVVE